MNVENNVAILKEAYQYWNDNKEQAFENWMDLMDEDVKIESIANGAEGMEFTEYCSCKEDALRYFQGLAEQWEMINFTAKEFIAQGDRVVVLSDCTWKNRKTGKTVETPKADIITIKESKILDVYEFYDTAKTTAASKL